MSRTAAKAFALLVALSMSSIYFPNVIAQTQNTGAIFAIHEFGFPHRKLSELRTIANKRGVPLIEDCAYGWGTEGIGSTGDYAIYSLTKAFPVQFGGYLVGIAFSHEDLWKRFGCCDRGKEEFTMPRLAHYLQQQKRSRSTRQENYQWYTTLFSAGRTYFPLNEATEPGAYILRTESEERMQEVSTFVRQFGIECGNYWRNSAIILPCHQRLAPAHREYIAGAVLATEREWCGVPRPQ
jgi:dTDP-4-amino-4,6-dideoxygalactose transaminase